MALNALTELWAFFWKALERRLFQQFCHAGRRVFCQRRWWWGTESSESDPLWLWNTFCSDRGCDCVRLIWWLPNAVLGAQMDPCVHLRLVAQWWSLTSVIRAAERSILHSTVYVQLHCLFLLNFMVGLQWHPHEGLRSRIQERIKQELIWSKLTAVTLPV